METLVANRGTKRFSLIASLPIFALVLGETC